MSTPSMLARLEQIEDLPTLPAIAMEVNKMLQDQEASINRLCERIEKDQVMVAKILKLVNSAFFGLSSRIDSLSHAVVLLGFNTIQSAVVSISLVKALSRCSGLDGFSMEAFWRHSVAVAVTSKHLALKSRLYPSDVCFLGGLLHDIGKVVLAQYFGAEFERVWRSSRENGLSFYEAEKMALPMGHPKIGGFLARKWKLPPNLVDAISHHHHVKASIGDPDFTMIVQVSDLIVHSVMDNGNDRIERHLLSPEAGKRLGPGLKGLSDNLSSIEEEIGEACGFFMEHIEQEPYKEEAGA